MGQKGQIGNFFNDLYDQFDLFDIALLSIQVVQLHPEVFQYTAVGAEECDADTENDQDQKE